MCGAPHPHFVPILSHNHGAIFWAMYQIMTEGIDRIATSTAVQTLCIPPGARLAAPGQACGQHKTSEARMVRREPFCSSPPFCMSDGLQTVEMTASRAPSGAVGYTGHTHFQR